nr:hypothetical protein [uncultured Acetatifactor sp.]
MKNRVFGKSKNRQKSIFSIWKANENDRQLRAYVLCSSGRDGRLPFREGEAAVLERRKPHGN